MYVYVYVFVIYEVYNCSAETGSRTHTEMYLCMYWGICGIFVVIVCTFCSILDLVVHSLELYSLDSHSFKLHSVELYSFDLHYVSIKLYRLVLVPISFLVLVPISIHFLIRNVKKFQLNLIWIDLYICMYECMEYMYE